jgi:hypothetical protein
MPAATRLTSVAVSATSWTTTGVNPALRHAASTASCITERKWDG